MLSNYKSIVSLVWNKIQIPLEILILHIWNETWESVFFLFLIFHSNSSMFSIRNHRKWLSAELTLNQRETKFDKDSVNSFLHKILPNSCRVYLFTLGHPLSLSSELVLFPLNPQSQVLWSTVSTRPEAEGQQDDWFKCTAYLVFTDTWGSEGRGMSPGSHTELTEYGPKSSACSSILCFISSHPSFLWLLVLQIPRTFVTRNESHC